jgi:carbonic anhydrase
MATASETLKRLQHGNRRFMIGLRGNVVGTGWSRRDQLAEGQKPFAIVLGCSDSCVPAELVFDQASFTTGAILDVTGGL